MIATMSGICGEERLSGGRHRYDGHDLSGCLEERKVGGSLAIRLAPPCSSMLRRRKVMLTVGEFRVS